MLWLNVTVTAIAGLLVLMGWLGKEERYRKIGLPLAFGLLIFNTALTVSKDITQSRLERERKADLIYIQKLNSPVYRLGFKFTNIPIDTLKTPKLVTVIRMDIDLSEYGQRRHFFGLMNLRFTNDSGWTISGNEFLSREATHLLIDSSGTHFSFWIDDFGIPWRENIAWRPANIADLSNLEIALGISPDPELWKTRPYGISYKGWCPVKQIDLYVNEMSLDNLLFTAQAHEDPYPLSPWVTTFSPDAEVPYADSLNFIFHINPMWLRANVLRSLE